MVIAAPGQFFQDFALERHPPVVVYQGGLLEALHIPGKAVGVQNSSGVGTPF
jgi:hypothetical protein